MKRYLLFAGDDYYPSGGFEDFITDADSIEELQSLISYTCSDAGKYDYVYLQINHPAWKCSSPSDQWLHIVDIEEGRIVFEDSTRNQKDEHFRFIGYRRSEKTI